MPPLDVRAQGTGAILRYLRELKNGIEHDHRLIIKKTPLQSL
jgi:hypothetical protein